MTRTYRSDDWDTYLMDYHDPHRGLEPLEKEVAAVDEALRALHEAGVLPDVKYDQARMVAFRKATTEQFEIPWSAITPRMQRLIYAINAVTQPQTMIAAGVF